MPPRKPGGHQQGLKTTLVITTSPEMRRLVEEEADAVAEEHGGRPNLSDVVNDALRAYFEDD